MYMKYFQHIVIIALIVTGVASCTTDIDLKLKGTEPMLVVDGSITTDTMAHGIFLQRTTDYFANSPVPGVSGATVTLSDGSSTIALTESGEKPGLYQTPSGYYGQAGKTYTLHIKNVDVNNDGIDEEYEASSVLNDVPELDDVSVEEVKLFGRQMWALKASFQDPKGVKNYYLFRNYRNGKCVSDTINEWGITADEFFDGTYLKDETIMYFSSTKQDEKMVVGDTAMLEMCSITEDYLGFVNDLVDEYRGRNPMFGGQPANIRTNIRQLSPKVTVANAPRGFFTAYAIKRKSVIYK